MRDKLILLLDEWLSWIDRKGLLDRLDSSIKKCDVKDVLDVLTVIEQYYGLALSSYELYPEDDDIVSHYEKALKYHLDAREKVKELNKCIVK